MIKNYKFNLERLKGYIYITTEPTNADVIINGKKGKRVLKIMIY